MLSPSENIEGRPGVGRVEAFSDGVVAIIVTIMVLELHPPVAAGLEKLWALWPVFFAYALSYIYVALYWSNHHRLFGHARIVTNQLVWSNMALLFTLSLVPFATAYLGEHHFSRDATLVYLGVLLLPCVTYAWLQRVVRATGEHSARAEAYHVATLRKGVFAIFLNVIGFPLTFVSPWIGIACAMLVAIFWFLPNSPLDRFFAGKAGQTAS
uniref:TMEM175 family protein n=1 Tax=uncultured Sphingomonas sp. TaxID=158754 RepID=UPI0035CA9101